MGQLIKSELRKMLFKKGVLIVWVVSLLFGTLLIHNGTVSEVYADVFFKSYGYTPIMGLVMFMILSGAYTLEYNSNMSDLINTTKNGKKKTVIAKGIGAGIAISIVNLSIVTVIYLDGLKKVHFKGLDIPLKNLWYFKGISSTLNVFEMMLIMIGTIIIASFFFAQLGLYLSSISKSASIPFILGGLIMGVPYILEAVLPSKFIVMTPLWGMISSQLIKHEVSLSIMIIQGTIFVAGCLIFPRLTYKAFIKENKR
ncbi:ABC transporter permease [Anaerosalibacter massiliensis]|uniref:ABC transporter permease n=1 Tax=Anaerosalibacter massiliensis TaxID=1347392 RepID=A0A9X2S8I5_9FIRM|nr:ABC transporter permease [Anaerosalibacter massiliensis]MCR2045166.1 ABC transporter permease [Anaerosalibacter massiliensis]